MEETLTKAGLDKKVQVQVGGAKVTFTPTNIDPTWHPEEDTFEVRSEAELYEPPHRPHNPAIRYLGPDDTSEPPKGTSDEVKALHAFMSMAANAEMGITDNVVLPAHYARFTIEPIRFICENNLNFFQANIVKYILRWDAKNGMEDLQKAKRYLNMFIKFVAKDPDWWKADTQ
jgi:hypothetical protein